MKRSHLVREVIETVVLTLLIFLVIRFVVQSYHVEGPSMQPGLHTDEYVLVNKVSYLFQTPGRGDVIVFHYPKDTTQDFIKRIVGLPGDTVRTDSTHVWVNGVLLNEPYIKEAINLNEPSIWKVPPGDYFVLGDNRRVSDDSRYWGFVPKDYIVGKAMLVYWPSSNWQILNTYPSVYVKIKANG
ncbi:MAG: signal peptidase I [Ktedonobacteraceae bacterium]|nr:signal peptidase I [Ktedonobacteraceae bacterium]